MASSVLPMDMALDDIIKSNKKYGARRRGGRGGRGGGGNPRFGNNKGSGGAFRRIRLDFKRTAQPYRKARVPREESTLDDDTVWEHDLYQEEEEEEEVLEEYDEEETQIRAIETGTKVSISNLEYTVSEENLKEIFGSTGQVKKVLIRYDRSGRSEGTGEITFVRKVDAQNAVRKFNEVQIDGKPVQLAIVGSNLQIPVQRNNRVRGNRRGSRNSGIVIQSGGRGNVSRRVRIGGNRGRGRGGRRYN